MLSTVLHHQDAFRLVAGVSSEMLYFLFIPIPQVIKAQAIQFFVHNGHQFCLQHPALGGIQEAFKDRILDALSVIHALFCNLPQAFFGRRRFRY